MSNGNAMIIHLIAGLTKTMLYKNESIFPKHMSLLEETLSNYATKLDLKNVTGVDTSKLAAKSDLASLKAEYYEIDLVKLKTVPVDLSKLSK